MKKCFNLTAVLLMVSGMLFFTSCDGDNDDNNPKSDSDIVGEWEYTSANVSITINDQDIVDYFIDAFDISEDSAEVWKEMFTESFNTFDGMSWEFSSDNKFSVTSPEGNESGTWNLSNDNKKLTITSKGESEVIDVKSLNSSKMELSYEEEFEEDANGDDVDETYVISMLLTLTKK